jgi:predicted Holliday junction resolvase-like endonuclease
MEMDAEFVVISLLVIFALIMVIYISVKSTQDDARKYQDALNDLYKQLQTGKISVQTYQELRLDLEEKYHKRQRDKGGF